MSTWIRPRSLFILIGLFCLVALDSWLLLSTFEQVLAQQSAVKKSYREIDQIAVVTSKLRDAEIQARRYTDSDGIDINSVTAMFDDVDREMTIATAVFAKDPVSLSLATKFEGLLRERRKSLEDMKTIAGRLTLERITSALRRGDQSYLRLAAILTKLKELREANLKTSLAPTSRFTKMFYIAALLTAFLNLGVGGLAYRQAEQLSYRSQKERATYESNSADMREASTAAAVVSGEIDSTDFAHAIRQFFIRAFGASAVKVYFGDDGFLREIDRPRTTAETVGDSVRLVDDVIQSDGPMLIENVPPNYWTIESGTGRSVPKHLLIVPLRFQKRVVGAIEVAFLGDFNKTSLERINKLTEIFGISLNAAVSRQRTRDLLRKTESQASELRVQQEELRTTNEELEQQARSLEMQQDALASKNLELETTRSELERKASDLTQTSRHKTDFLAKMSHELRTPLNGLLILSTLLVENKEQTLTSQQQKFARSINSAGHDLLTLINDILDLSKIEAKKLSVHVTEFTLGDVFASKRRTFEPQTTAKGLRLVDELSDGLKGFRLTTDRQRLDQILRNFLSNAIKFTEKGDVRLTATVDIEGEKISFAVTDDGIGIPPERQKIIFEAFEQSDASVSSQFGGTGLGLTIARELAVLLGGEISLTSKPGEGSTFRLTIPVHYKGAFSGDSRSVHANLEADSNITIVAERSGDLESSEQLRDVRERIANLDKSKKSILVVEDDETFRTAVADTVRGFGFAPVEVADGAVAMEVLNYFHPDAILLDIKLPGLSGLGLLEILKNSPNLRHIPVHMISGLEYQTNALRMGALGYLTKPVTTEKIRSALERIENLMSRRLSRLLLIEDNIIQKDALSALFEGNDIDVVSAPSGKKALEDVRSGSFDCIVLDLTLPDVSGFDLLAELRKLEISLPPIVIYTGKDLSDHEQEYLAKYSESIVIKGARSPDRLLDEVNLFLHRVESKLPDEKRSLISALRSNEQFFEGRNVLIVDDDIRNIFALTSALEAKGLKVLFARDGSQALDVIEANQKIDIVLMDIMMPVMDGIEAMKEIRRSPVARIRSLPVIALTAKAMREDHERCMDAGANDYLTKPINLDNLMTIIKVWLPKSGPKFKE